VLPPGRLREVMMRNAGQSETAPHVDERPADSKVCPEACVARALLCLKEGEDDPQQQQFWLAEAVRFLQRASDAWKAASGVETAPKGQRNSQ
jgi:hypothetical protein